MKESIKISKEMMLELRFKRVQVRNSSKILRKSIPAARSIVRKSFLTNSRRGIENRGIKEHVQGTGKFDLRREESRCKRVNALESKSQKLEIDPLLYSEPVKIFEVLRNMRVGVQVEYCTNCKVLNSLQLCKIRL